MAKTIQRINAVKPDLNKMGVIITRPKAQSQQLMTRVRKHNGRYFILPCLEISATTHTETARKYCIDKQADYDFWLFTSPNSVKYAQEFGLTFTEIPCIAIGLGTKNALTKHTSDIIQADKPYTSEALINTLRTKAIAGKRILIISGEGGRRLLGDALVELGAQADYVDVYRRHKPQSIDLTAAVNYNRSHPLTLLISSQEALDNYFEAAQIQDPNNLSHNLIVASARLKSYAASLGYTQIHVAQSAYPLDLWEALEVLATKAKPPDLTSPIVQHPLPQATAPNKVLTEEPSMTTDNQETTTNDDTSHNATIVQTAAQQKSSNNSALAFLALALGAAGLGVSGYHYLSPRPPVLPDTQVDLTPYTQAIDQLTAQVTQLKQSQASLENMERPTPFDARPIEAQLNALATASASLPGLQAANGELRSQLDRVNAMQESLVKRLSEQEQLITNVGSIAKSSEALTHSLETKFTENLIDQKDALQNVNALANRIKNTTDLNALNLVETHYLIKLATYKLRFEADIKASMEALTLASSRLNEINDAKFTETHNRIQENLALLGQTNAVDRDGIARDIQTIARLIPNMKTQSNDAMDALKRKFLSEAGNIKPEDGWYDKLSKKLKSLISIKRERTPAPELMAFEDAFYLNHNLQLQLSAARFAILQNHPEVFKAALTDVRAWINEYYSDNNDQFHDVIAKLDALINLDITSELPDISPTLKSFEAAKRVYQGEGL